MEVIGYKYTTEAEALKVVNDLNQYWQLPKPNGQSEFNINLFDTWGGGYWIRQNNDWYQPVLGLPYKFEVPNPPALI